jgi:type III restriction enzyme
VTSEEFVETKPVPELIDNPVINSPYLEPEWHFAFDKGGITADQVQGRRESEFFIPVPQPKVLSAKEQLEFDAMQLRRERNQLINAIRLEVRTWRRTAYPGITDTTRRLLEYWQRTDREVDQRLFFCQLEAAETAIYLTEVAASSLRRRDRRSGDLSIAEQMDNANVQYNDGLPRIAFKIATGGGKTVVMAMLIAWHALNRGARPGDDRFCANFLMVAPGITVRDRLQVLRPEHEASYYRVMDLVPRDLSKDLLLADVEIVNYHQFLPRPRMGASKLTRQILRTDDLETEDEIVRRVCGRFERLIGPGRHKGELIVVNDEAHHCYKSSQIEAEKEEAELVGDEKDEAKRDRAAAQAWFTGLKAIQKVLGVKAIYDLSATPFFLKGSGYGEGKLFPWVASDFALIDAIECGIVKVPRVPVADDSSKTAAPVFLRLWESVKDQLPKGKRVKIGAREDLTIPANLEQALRLLYASYERTMELWRENQMPIDPAFIVVCSNTNVSKLVYDWIGGWKQKVDGSRVDRDGALPLFRNVEGGKVLDQPRTLLIDSSALESGEGLTDEFRRLAEDQIAEFKFQYQLRTGKQSDDISDADLLREALNTVGRPGRLGEKIRCVVSVAMLSEGWDANTVTHILGVRAFRSQLLCEQVIGRGLRRTNYVVKDDGLLEAQYADVYGVPFAFIPTGRVKPVVDPPTPTNLVRALPERRRFEIQYPRVAGYRYRIPADRLVPTFDRQATMRLKGVPTEVEVDPIVGQGDIHRDNWKDVREQTVAFHVAQKVLASHAWEQEGRPVWLFPQVLELSRQWVRDCLILEDGATQQMLLLSAYMAEAADKIRMSFVRQRVVREGITPVLADDGEIGSTAGTEFTTARTVLPTTKSHVDYAALPPKGGWEAHMVEALDASPHVAAWVKNEHLSLDGLGLRIPWVYQGAQRSYLPDFIAVVRLADERVLNLVIEVSGFDWPGKREKDETMHTFWIPAINNWGRLGSWEHVEFDQRDAANFDFALLAYLEKLGGPYA